MATDAQALAAGFSMPAGGDQISLGDDAIRQNARVALDLIDAAEWWHRDLLVPDADILKLRHGVHGVAAGGTATALGLPAARVGSLTIAPAGRGDSKILTFQTNYISEDYPAEVWQAATDNSGSTLGPWRNLTDRDNRGLPPVSDIDTWFHPSLNGTWTIQPAAVTAAGSTNPTPYAYTLTQQTLRNSITTQTAKSNHTNDANVYYRAETSTGSKTFLPWKRLLTTQDLAALPAAGASVRHELTAQDLRAYRGTVNTGGATPVALTFDDYPKAFRDVVLPLLRARKLPATLGLGSGMYEQTSAPIYAGAVGTTWAEIDRWTTADGIEIANHGRTHGSATTPAQLQAEIVDGLTELQAALPSRPILTWMQPSVTYPESFNNGDSIRAYADTLAGRLLLEHHAYVTGVRKLQGSTLVPLTGHGAPQGLARNWFDSSRGIEGCKTLISTAAPGRGLIIAAHADRFGTDAGATVAELIGFLDWLAAEQAAGRIKVLTLSEWSISNASK